MYSTGYLWKPEVLELWFEESILERKMEEIEKQAVGDEMQLAPGASFDGIFGHADAVATSEPQRIESSPISESKIETYVAIDGTLVSQMDQRTGMGGQGMDENLILLEWDLDFDHSKSSHNNTNDLTTVTAVSVSSENVYTASTISVHAGGVDFLGNLAPEEEVANRNTTAGDNNKLNELDSESDDENSPTIDIRNENQVEVVVEEAQLLNPLSSRIRVGQHPRLPFTLIEKNALKEGIKKYYNQVKSQIVKEGRVSHRVRDLITKVLDRILDDPGEPT